MNNLKFLFLFLPFAMAVVSSCNHSEEPDPNAGRRDTIVVDNGDTLVGDTALRKQVLLLLPAVYHGNFVTTTWAATQPSASPSITLSPADSFPATLCIDCGNTAQWGIDGFQHFGTLSASLTAPFDQAGSVTTLDLTHYRTYGNTVNGTQVITNQGTNEDGQMIWKVETKNAHLGISPDYTYFETTTRQLFNINPETPAYKINGQFRVNTNTGVDDAWSYIANIDEKQPLVIPFNELFPTEGKLNVKFDPELVIDLEKVYPEGGEKGVFKFKECTITFIGKGDGQSYWAKLDFKILGISQSFRFRLTYNGLDYKSFKWN